MKCGLLELSRYGDIEVAIDDCDIGYYMVVESSYYYVSFKLDELSVIKELLKLLSGNERHVVLGTNPNGNIEMRKCEESNARFFLCITGYNAGEAYHITIADQNYRDFANCIREIHFEILKSGE